MICKVVENLYIGDAQDVLDESRTEQLTKLLITHVLTVSTKSVPQEKQVGGIVYMFVPALDLSSQDMFADYALANSLRYISTNIESGGRLLVHCEAGVSRSAFVVAAYLMQKFQWSPTKAIECLQCRRPVVRPNDGFIQQLQIFENAGFDADMKTVSQCSLYKKWLLNFSSPGGFAGFNLEKTSTNRGDLTNVEYRCRKCRKILFYDDHIMRHITLAADVNVAGAKDEVECSFRYLLLPMKWMSLREYQGKIFCPSCDEKLGHYVWGGRVCDGTDGRRCGTAVRPWTYVNQNKVDRVVKTDNSVASPADIIINKPPQQVQI